MSAADPARATDPRPERWDAFWGGRELPEDFYPPSERIRAQLLPHAQRRGRILEVGAGSGRDSAALARAGARVVLLDASEAALELAARNPAAFRGRSLVRGDAVRAPFPDGSFDVVFHQGLLEHFRDPLPLLRENARLLRPGGLLLVDVPQTFHPWTLLKRPLIALDRWFAGWETQYAPGKLERVVAAAGFERVLTYGDWMRPSLAWRLAREALRRFGVRLPMNPPSVRRLGGVRRSLREAALRRRPALYTVHTIGVVGRKPGP